MKLQIELANRLLEIPDIQPAEADKSNLFVCENKEIARIREDGFVDVKLTHPLIRALGLVNDETTPGWIQMSLKKGSDFPVVIAFVHRAANESKRSHHFEDEEKAS